VDLRHRIAVFVAAGALVTAVAPAVFAAQPPTAPPATAALTVVTNASWLVDAGQGTAFVECPHPAWTASIAGASWIWATFPNDSCTSNTPATAPVASHTFSTTFDVPGVPQSATLQFAVDNTADVSINGTQVASLPTVDLSNFQTGWSGDVTAALEAGPNTITITAANTPGSTCAGCNPAGLLAGLTVTYTLTTKSQCKDSGWTQWTVPVFVNQGDCVSYVVSHGNDPSQAPTKDTPPTTPPTQGQLTSKDQCKDGGWQNSTDPVFVNQGDCVSYFVSQGNDPSQTQTNGNSATKGPKTGNSTSQGHGNGHGGSKH
jgi:hypothetical protein